MKKLAAMYTESTATMDAPAQIATSAIARPALAVILNVFPGMAPAKLSDSRHMIAGVMGSLMASDSPYSPFKSIPATTMSISNPASVLHKLGALGLKVTYQALSEFTKLPRGVLSMTSQGKMELSPSQLEDYRLGLVALSKSVDFETESASPDEDLELRQLMKQFGDYQDKQVFADRLIIEYQALHFQGRHLTGYREENELGTFDMELSVEAVMTGIRDVWREEVLHGTAYTHSDCTTFDDILRKVTCLRGKQRGFHKLVSAVHDKQPAFNARVSYPATNFNAYHARYSDVINESGLTAEVVLGYCFYLGINPVSILIWFAEQNEYTPMQYKVHPSATIPANLVEYKFWISPVEHGRLLNQVFALGIIPDTARWIYQALSPSVIYFQQLASLRPAIMDMLRKVGRDIVMADMAEETVAAAGFGLIESDHWLSINSAYPNIRGNLMAPLSDPEQFKALVILLVLGMKATEFRMDGDEGEEVTEENFMALAKSMSRQYGLGFSAAFNHPSYEQAGLIEHRGQLAARGILAGLNCVVNLQIDEEEFEGTSESLDEVFVEVDKLFSELDGSSSIE